VSPTSASGTGLKFVLDPSKSEASYAIREQLARINLPSDAIGKTNAIAGSLTLKPDGSVDSANSKITVDLSTLKSDEGMRDNYVRQNILQTGQYPQAVFVPTQISGLPATLPTSGNVSFKVTGDLTIRNVTKPVTWDVTGSVSNGVATGTATTSFTFEDFSLTQPRVPVVLSVVDKITLNATVTFTQSK
jgi:polyisoprenoid-binding protein YceI